MVGTGTNVLPNSQLAAGINKEPKHLGTALIFRKCGKNNEKQYDWAKYAARRRVLERVDIARKVHHKHKTWHTKAGVSDKRSVAKR